MTESNSINPIGPGSSQGVNPSSNAAPSSTFNANSAAPGDPNDPWSFGGYFDAEQSKKFQSQMEQNISNEMKKDAKKAHETALELKKSIEDSG